MRRTGRISGVLGRLRSDVRGNVLMLVAASLIPLLGFIGGGIDLGRLYLVQVRLQHACDAGALAGRKAMGGGAWAQTSPSPNGTAVQFFNANFPPNSYGSTSATPVFSETKGDVSGTATATVPMTVMTLFGSPTRTLTVTCDTQMQLPNTDVMFVLDNTGSMMCAPGSSNCPATEQPSSKITGLRTAVKCFFEVLSQLNTDDTSCTGATSGTGVSNGAQIRFGFVPYSTNVNVSQLGLPAGYFASSWKYQSRVPSWTAWSTTTTNCSSGNSVPANTATTQYQPSGNSNCKVQTRTRIWSYGSVAQDLSTFSYANKTVTLPIGSGYTNTTLNWDGCLEEASATSDINAVPVASDATTQYAPALPEALFLRNATGTNLLGFDFSQYKYQYQNMTTAASTSTTNYYNSVRDDYYFCPAAAQKIKTWTAADFDTYVNGLKAAGNTYHDIGMLWGGRIMSPEGMFKGDTALTSEGGQIQHHVIFMTDGDAQAGACDYHAYGIAWYDQRTTTDVGSAYDCARGAVNATLTSQINTRLAALCTSVKNEPNTTLWVISFGGVGIAADTKTRLTTCATDANHYFDATSNASLQSAFQLIASQISQLRLTK